MEFNIEKAIDEGVEKEPREEGYQQKTWYASGLGSCPTSRYLDRISPNPDTELEPRVKRVLSIGNMFEDWLVEKIKHVEDVTFEQQTRVEDTDLNISGKLDLLATKGDDKVVYEIKSKHSKAFWYMKTQGAPINNQMQLWFYLHCLEIDEGRLVFLSKDDLTIKEYVVYRNDKELKKKVFDEARYLNMCLEKKIPPLPYPKTKWQSKYSNYGKQIFEQPEYLLPSGEVVTNKEMLQILKDGGIYGDN